MDWLIINIPFFVAVVALVILVILSYKSGLVRSICTVIGAIAATILTVLIAFAVRKYLAEARILFMVTVVLIVLLLILLGIVSMALKGIKFISELPVISFFNKILGAAFGVGATVVLIWAVYCLTIVLDSGAIATSINNCVADNPIMGFLYEHNPMYNFIALFSDTIHKADLLGKLGM